MGGGHRSGDRPGWGTLGGSGGSGVTVGGGLSGAQDGKAPGNHTFNGITATGGGKNGGTPGAGGEGGRGGFIPRNGSAGARGQAWIHLITP